MSSYIEYGVKLSDGQKSKLLNAFQKRTPLTLRLKHSHLRGPDELMLTQRQITKIKKSLANGTGSDLKISQTQIRSLVKRGGNLFSSLAKLGAKLLPLAVKGVSKVAPALASGAANALGEIGLKKLFGRGISIPKRFFPLLPPFASEFTKAQIDQINKVFKTGGRLVIKPTRKQIEGGFLGTQQRLEYQQRLVWLQSCLDQVFRLTGELLVIREVFMFHPHKERVTIHPPLLELGKIQ